MGILYQEKPTVAALEGWGIAVSGGSTNFRALGKSLEKGPYSYMLSVPAEHDSYVSGLVMQDEFGAPGSLVLYILLAFTHYATFILATTEGCGVMPTLSSMSEHRLREYSNKRSSLLCWHNYRNYYH